MSNVDNEGKVSLSMVVGKRSAHSLFEKTSSSYKSGNPSNADQGNSDKRFSPRRRIRILFSLRIESGRAVI